METFTMQSMLPILAVCAIIFFLLFLKARSHIIVRLIQRFVLGFVMIVLCNTIFSYFSLKLFVGINPGTLLTCTVFGLPGVCALFLIQIL